ncbi:hypothetical protein [Aeromonas bivalvium]|uniref:hypothetical protein n=1 Tax=Aeromonas bivalvium TaxID=440079 RepID=UPI003D1CBA77
MLLIMSGSYIPQELGAEFGKIPPSFLPLGNKRLFQHQVKLYSEPQPIYITLPDDYPLCKNDETWLHNNNVNIIRIDSELTLGQALITAWNLIEDKTGKTLRLLFGDTLLDSLPLDYDLVATSQSQDSYQWSQFNHYGILDNDERNLEDVICGYFTFSNFNKFVKYLVLSKLDFINALENYRKHIGLTSFTVSGWLDFGHINTYYQSKVKYTTQRSFNDLSITLDHVKKSSSNHNKISAEANWFKEIPDEIRLFTPQFLGSTSIPKATYKLEYLYNSALNELFVFSQLPTTRLNSILMRCFDFIDLCSSHKAEVAQNSQTIRELFSVKTEQRVQEYLSTNGFDIETQWSFNHKSTISIREMIDTANLYLPCELPHQTIMHGDLCFSNILYDFRTNRIKTIDPRGITQNGGISIYGDYRYDLAKLSHSVLGLYDWIIAGYHHTHIDKDRLIIEQRFDIPSRIQEVQATFISMIEQRYNIPALCLYAMQIHLFLSMLPLHTDDIQRQNGLFANAFRIYEELKRLES